jgi:hypothetical protein
MGIRSMAGPHRTASLPDDIWPDFCLKRVRRVELRACRKALALVRTKDEIPGSIPGQDYLVFSGELRLGRIHKVAMTGGRERWHWNLFALVGPPDRIAHDGYTDTLKQAKAEFAASVRAILALAHWHELEPLRRFSDASTRAGPA